MFKHSAPLLIPSQEAQKSSTYDGDDLSLSFSSRSDGDLLLEAEPLASIQHSTFPFPVSDPVPEAIVFAALFNDKAPVTSSVETTFKNHGPTAFEYKLNDIMEPTPFREGSSLQVAYPSFDNLFFLNKEGTKFGTVDHYNSVSVVSDDSGDEEELSYSNFDNALSPKRKISMSSTSTKRKRTKFNDEDDSLVVLKPHQDAKWEEFYLSLCEYKIRNGHCRVPHSYKQDPALARWSKRQRYQYKLKLDGKPNTLTTDRLDKLEKIGFDWDPQTSVWETRLQELVQYLEMHGDCNVPCRYAQNPQLGMWVKRQRRQYKVYQSKGGLSELSEKRFRILNEMGFIWEMW